MDKEQPREGTTSNHYINHFINLDTISSTRSNNIKNKYIDLHKIFKNNDF